jgi:hypothetical protein
MTNDSHVLIFVNEVAGGRRLTEAVRRRAGAGVESFSVAAPQNQPRAGYLIFDESVYEAASNRVDITLAVLREIGIEAEGEVLDPHPALALDDAVRTWQPTEIVISSRPEVRFGLLRRDLVEYARQRYGVPVEHVPVRLEEDSVAGDVTHTLVIANQTVASGEVIRHLKAKAAAAAEGRRRHRFTIVCPLAGTGAEDMSAAKGRLARAMAELYREGIDSTGQVMNPDAFTSVQNALQYYQVDEILISTFPEESSRWMQGDLIERVRGLTAKPVEHVIAVGAAPIEPALVAGAEV